MNGTYVGKQKQGEAREERVAYYRVSIRRVGSHQNAEPIMEKLRLTSSSI